MTARILLVEDNQDNAEVLARILVNAGYEVVSTPSGREAVLLAAKGGWDLALIDVEVEELSGLGVARALQDLGNIPMVAMSAGAGPWRREAFAAGATACLPKPFTMTALTTLVDAIITGARQRPWPPGDVRQLGGEDLGRIRGMSVLDLDTLPFGVIRVDKHGVITAYNAFESHAAGREAGIVGTRFADLVPCAMVKEFAGVIEQGFVEQRLDTVLRYTFPVREADCIVSVRLFHDAALNQVWIFVTRRRPSEP